MAVQYILFGHPGTISIKSVEISFKYNLEKELPAQPRGLPASPRPGTVHFESKPPVRPRRTDDAIIAPAPLLRQKKKAKEANQPDSFSNFSHDTQVAVWAEVRDTKDLVSKHVEVLETLA